MCMSKIEIFLNFPFPVFTRISNKTNENFLIKFPKFFEVNFSTSIFTLLLVFYSHNFSSVKNKMLLVSKFKKKKKR